MPHRELPSIEDFRRAVFAGLSTGALNDDLKYAVRTRCRETPVHEIVEALGSAARIDLEIIVDAAEFGHVRTIEALVGVVDAAEAQDYFDRALIGLSVNDFATPQEYLKIAKTLIAHGADPEAYETTCRQLSGSDIRKEHIHALFCDVIDARETARDTARQEEWSRRRAAATAPRR
ncbi:MAG TPA: hypothetical protein PLX33_08540 [Alphaproteobacteria bacterium]|nr:hypothetical protein [Alphaproteobacteria bacterium]